MNSEGYKFYLYNGLPAKIYNGTIIALLLFAMLYAYLNVGLNIASTFIYLVFIFFGSVLVYPLFKSKSPLYVVDSEGIKQNKYWFFPRYIPWTDIQSISYPSDFLFSRKGSFTLTRVSATLMMKKITIGLSDVDNPYEFLKSLNTFKPFGFDELKSKIYFERYDDREKIFYALLLYLCIGLAVILMASYYMPYIILEDNEYSDFWGVLFFVHLLSSIIISILVHKDVIARKSFIKLAIVLWIVIFIGPVLIEQNAYYNLRAMIAKKRHDYPKAEEYIQSAIELHPKGYSYYETLGKILYEENQYERTIETFRYLLLNDERLTDYYHAYYNLWIGKSYWKLGRYSEAEEIFSEVKAYNIDDLNREIRAIKIKQLQTK